jgi:hypothetical protein
MNHFVFFVPLVAALSVLALARALEARRFRSRGPASRLLLHRPLSDLCLTHHWWKIVVEAEQLRYGRQRADGAIRQFELQAHSIELSPHRKAVVIGVTEGYVKFRRQMNSIRQQQPNAGGREISHRTSDKGILFEQDHTPLGALVPRGQSPFNASIH